MHRGGVHGRKGGDHSLLPPGMSYCRTSFACPGHRHHGTMSMSILGLHWVTAGGWKILGFRLRNRKPCQVPYDPRDRSAVHTGAGARWNPGVVGGYSAAGDNHSSGNGAATRDNFIVL